MMTATSVDDAPRGLQALVLLAPHQPRRGRIIPALSMGAALLIMALLKFYGPNHRPHRLPSALVRWPEWTPTGRLWSRLSAWIQTYWYSLSHSISRTIIIAARGTAASEPQQTLHCGGDERLVLPPINEDGGSHHAGGATPSWGSKARGHAQAIQRVLRFWFGQYPPEEAQKKLWMISDQAGAWRKQVDRDLTQQFASWLMDLATNQDGCYHCWCDVVDLSSGEDDGDDGDDGDHGQGWHGWQGKVAAVIVLDQFSRHIHRFLREADQEPTSSSANSTWKQHLPPQSQLDTLALKTTRLFLEHHHAEIQCGMIPLPMYIFALMPLRHANTMDNVALVQQRVEQSADMLQQYDALLRRFRKATNRRMAVLQDQARQAGDDRSQTDYTDQDILETFPFETDMRPSGEHPVHKAMCAFLEQQNIQAGDNTPTPLIVSLSGGVDSMVIATVLSYLVKSCGYNLSLWAVHIDYANRPESAAEAAYVGRYCAQLGITFRCRRIEEVTRGVTARDEYERVARDVRYTFYKQVMEKCNTAAAAAVEVGVFLGHHRGDLRENVLSNAHKGCGPLDLSGMTAVSKNDGVVLYRPLLGLEKSFIFDYAHTFGVPYFKDTTPHWSTRGKLRHKLLPLLEEIYGEGSMNNLSSLAVESDACRELLHQVALGPFLEQVAYKPMGITFETIPWKTQGHFFWKFVLREALHSVGLGMFTDGTVASFMERIQAEPIRAGWLQCRKDYAVYLQEEGRIFVLYPQSFPWRKSDAYNCLGQTVDYGRDHAVRVGPWRVTAHVLRQVHSVLEPSEIRDRLEIRAVPSMMDLMEGSIDYYLQVPATGTIVDDPKLSQQDFQNLQPMRPLVFTKFSKMSRPRAWKSIDIKLQETLPVLGNDEMATSLIASKSGQVLLAKVTLRLSSHYAAAGASP